MASTHTQMRAPQLKIYEKQHNILHFYRGHPVVLVLYNNLQLKGRQTQLIIKVYKQLITLRATSFGYLYSHHQAHTKGHLAMS